MWLGRKHPCQVGPAKIGQLRRPREEMHTYNDRRPPVDRNGRLLRQDARKRSAEVRGAQRAALAPLSAVALPERPSEALPPRRASGEGEPNDAGDVAPCQGAVIEDSTSLAFALSRQIDGEKHESHFVVQARLHVAIPPRGDEGLALRLGGEERIKMLERRPQVRLRTRSQGAGQVTVKVFVELCGRTNEGGGKRVGKRRETPRRRLQAAVVCARALRCAAKRAPRRPLSKR